ncbi:MAG: type IV pilus twitching motility protein PilT [Synergistaceae bacterium]|nr:type IV pilus twitching motility protein PilT [Synergistaceae bacterium]
MRIDDLLTKAGELDASDLHLSEGLQPAFRVDGKIDQHPEYPSLSAEDMENVLESLLLPPEIGRFKKSKEHDFSFTYRSPDGKELRFRGNAYYESGRMGIALRLIPMRVRTLEELKLPPVLARITEQRRGLFLVTGPTGHGKSSTLAALVQMINCTRKEHIITIEDPIEYIFKSEKCIVHQRHVGIDTDSFAEALKRALRQDPDVILIGEMRDLETVAAAITAAETGHLVMGTLHTQDAAQSIDRIIDVFPPHQQQQIRIQLASIIIGICSQQLLPLSTGGRGVATEILLANAAVRNCIKEGKTNQIKTLIQTGTSIGMQTMEQSLADLVNQGVMHLGTAMEYAYDPNDLKRLLYA